MGNSTNSNARPAGDRLKDTTTRTGSGLADLPDHGVFRVPTLTLVFGPDPSRWGERMVPGASAFPLNRVHPVFPGGPLADPEVSRAHAEVRPAEDGGLLVRDLGSKNGTYVGLDRVNREGRRLVPGDVVRIGDTLVLYHETLAPPPGDHPIEGLLGHSDAARSLRATLARAARSHANVLLLGESGTGKEVAARAIGSLGRPGRPFLAFNAAAVPPALLDSTLFGHVRGAFTDAREPRPGLFRAADRGTLFLDEVADLAPETQARLLRVVEDRRVLPVGGTSPVAVDVRLVAATNRDLASEVAAGRFRGDLYARLAGLVIRLAPLRERREDIPLLARAFAVGAGWAGPPQVFTASAMTRLMRHPWPFNVRELKTLVEQALAEGRHRGGALHLGPLLLERLDEHARLFGPDRAPPPGSLDRAAVTAALAGARGNMTLAARMLGKDRGQFYRIVKRLGLDLERFRK